MMLDPIKKRKKMRPDKPGCYWWEDRNGSLHVIEFDDNMETPNVMFLNGYSVFMDPEQLEELFDFMRWIGPAHPPNLEPTTVHEMVSQWISRNGADGLWNEEGPCGCDGSAPCGDGPYPECEAAMAGGPGIDVDGQEVDVLYYPIEIKSGDDNG
jgi:hypothetical protein